ILVSLLELENGNLLGAALSHDLAGDGGFGGVLAVQHFLLVGVNGQNRTKGHFFAHVPADAFDANGVAGRDAILLSPGLNDSVHLSSEAYRQTKIIRAYANGVNEIAASAGRFSSVVLEGSIQSALQGEGKSPARPGLPLIH